LPKSLIFDSKIGGVPRVKIINHIIELHRILGRLHTVCHASRDSKNLATEDVSGQLETWKGQIPTSDLSTSIPGGTSWFTLQYQVALVHLSRPSPAFPKPPSHSLQTAFDHATAALDMLSEPQGHAQSIWLFDDVGKAQQLACASTLMWVFTAQLQHAPAGTADEDWVREVRQRLVQTHRIILPLDPAGPMEKRLKTMKHAYFEMENALVKAYGEIEDMATEGGMKALADAVGAGSKDRSITVPVVEKASMEMSSSMEGWFKMLW
jgi:hypothetical protein